MADLNCPACRKEVKTLRVQYECENGHTWGETIDRKVTDSPTSQTSSTTKRRMMPFGKYGPSKGDHRAIEDLPLDYISWCLENMDNLRDDLREELQNQIDLKSGKGVVRQEVKREGTKFTFK